VVELGSNRLVVFDDRLAHAVARVDGTMNPVKGRFALDGHLSEAKTAVLGALRLEMVIEPLAAALHAFGSETSAQLASTAAHSRRRDSAGPAAASLRMTRDPESDRR
jgi:hypothetical protein